jgi:hypothetical protein
MHVKRNHTSARTEMVLAGVALLALLTGQVMLSVAIRGTNFAGGDGKMAQAVILATQKFGGIFHFNNINPIQGLGSQILPLNVWLNPTYWPFAVLHRALAPDASAVVALAIFATACYVMVRCFDVPMLPSVVAAQLCIVLFAPIIFVLKLATVFSLMVGNAVVYAPHMVALGLLARLEPGSWRRFGLITAGICGLLVYSICCDPLWSTVNGVSWALPFAIVALSPIRPKPVLVRGAALGCCVIVLVVSGAAEYLYTLVQYTTRIQFPALADRVRGPDYNASILFYSPYMKYFYAVWLLGWVLGLLTLRGRARLLALTGLVTGVAFLAEVVVVYLLVQNVAWSLPLPVYTEQALFPLFVASAVTGYWGAWRAVAMRRRAPGASRRARWGRAAVAWVVVALVPASVVAYAVGRPPYMTSLYNEPWPDEPQLIELLTKNTAQAIGRPFQGATLFWGYDYAVHLTTVNVWVRGIPTISEYSQLVTPQSIYFNYSVLKSHDSLNSFFPKVDLNWPLYFNVLQMFGTRYYITDDHRNPPAYSQFDEQINGAGHASVALLPLGVHHRSSTRVSGFSQNDMSPTASWHAYELRHPNVGDYSPTQVMAADTGDGAVALMTRPDFDFTRHAVLPRTPDERLVPARDMRMSLIRGGLHVSGRSEGTSLVVLPQQFSHCLRARDRRVRLVRANLMLTGLIFSGSVDTDIVFDYGIFTPRCRRADLSDIKRLKLQIGARPVPLSGSRLFPDWQGARVKLSNAAMALK